jgi:hypothetical protein
MQSIQMQKKPKCIEPAVSQNDPLPGRVMSAYNTHPGQPDFLQASLFASYPCIQ